MKKQKKVVLIISIVAVVLVAAISIFVIVGANSGVENGGIGGGKGETLSYSLSEDKTYYVVNGLNKEAEDVVIPATYKDLPVKAIGANAFGEGIKSVTIPESITSIGKNAFLYCQDLETVYIKDLAAWCNVSFGSVSANPLFYASKFYLSDELVTDLVIPETVTGINAGAFFRANTITSLTVPNGVEYIGASAFANCTELKTVNVADSVTELGTEAFMGAPVETVTGPSEVCSAVKNAELKSVVITSGDAISKNGFSRCAALSSIVISDSVKEIGEGAFTECENLASITIGGNVKSIGEDAFTGLTKLTSVNYTGTIDGWAETEFANEGSNPFAAVKDLFINGALVTEANITSAKQINAYAFLDFASLESVNLGDSVTNIAAKAFKNCANLKNVSVSDKIIDISAGSFFDCKNVKYNEYKNANYLGNENNLYVALITAPSKNITSCSINTNTRVIAAEAFAMCASLKGIVIPDSVVAIGTAALAGCTQLSSANLSDNLQYLGRYAFNSCNNLKGYYKNGAYYLGSNQNMYMLLFKADKKVKQSAIDNKCKFIYDAAFSGCNDLESITIPNSVTHVGERAFANRIKLTSVTIPASITSISPHMFYACNRLTNVVISDGITSIGEHAFEDCTLLESVTIPDSVVEIDISAFSRCKSMTSLTIGKNVKSIADKAFYDCENLRDIYYGGTQEEWQAIAISESAFNGRTITVHCADQE